MGSPVPHNFLGRLDFEFKRDEARSLMLRKKELLTEKIADRTQRIEKLKTDNGMTDADIVELLNQMRRAPQQQTYTLSRMSGNAAGGGGQQTVTLGVAANLLAEMDARTAEKKALSRLDMLLKFLPNAVEPIKLSDSDLNFLSEAGAVEEDY